MPEQPGGPELTSEIQWRGIGSRPLRRGLLDLAPEVDVRLIIVEEDVVDVILDGEVGDPAAARPRLRQQLNPLVFEVNTAYSELAEEIRTADVFASISEISLEDQRFAIVAACPMYEIRARQLGTVAGVRWFDQFRSLARENAEEISRLAKKALPPEDVYLRSQAWATGIGFFVSQMLADFLA